MGSNSEPTQIGELTGFRRLQRQIAERRAWQEANPELNAAWDEALAEDARFNRVRQERLAEQNIRDAIPDMLRRLDVPLDAVVALRNLRSGLPVDAAKKFLAADVAEKRFLLLLGKPGAGKTVAAAYVLAHALLHRRPRDPHEVAAFTRATTFSRLSKYASDDRAWFESLCRVSVLVLDDLGVETLGAIGAELFDELVDRRHGNRLRTVITSNLDEKAFTLRIGIRAADRIRPTSIVAEIVGQSLRNKTGAPRAQEAV